MATQERLSKLNPFSKSSRHKNNQREQERGRLLSSREATITSGHRTPEDESRMSDEGFRQLMREMKELGRRNQLLEQELAQSKKLLTRENEELTQRVQSLAQEMEDQLEGSRMACAEAVEERDALRLSVAQIRCEYRDKVTHLSEELNRIQGKADEKVATLEAKLTLAHRTGAFLSTIDSVTHIELREMVVSLNSDIFQLAALVADAVTTQDTEMVKDRGTYQDLEKWLGAGMMKFAAHPELDVHFRVEVCLQAVATQFAEWRVNIWDLDPARDKVLREIYTVIRRDEPNSISSRWRTLARKYATMLSFSGRTSEEDTKLLTRLLKQALKVTGSQMTDKTTDWGELLLTRSLEIVNQSVVLRKAIAEDLLSGSFTVIGRSTRAIFSRDTMDVDIDDISGHSSDPDGRGIMCITQLGLAGDERLEDSWRMEMRTKVLVKAKVFLQSDVEYV